MLCWAAYTGAPVFLDEVIRHTGHGLARQADRAGRDPLPRAADGFGLAWYGAKPLPGRFRDTRPDWADPNLQSLMSRVQSDLVLACVATAPSLPQHRTNCHPFAAGQWSFMLNGQVGDGEGFRPDADRLLPAAFAAQRQGTTGSEALFLMALAEGLDDDPRRALEHAVARLMLLARARGEAPRLRMTAALSDGQRLYTVRYATEGVAPPLRHQWSARVGGRAIRSGPVAGDRAGWDELPEASFCTFDGRAFRVEPFLPYGLAAAA